MRRGAVFFADAFLAALAFFAAVFFADAFLAALAFFAAVFFADAFLAVLAFFAAVFFAAPAFFAAVLVFEEVAARFRAGAFFAVAMAPPHRSDAAV
ncbi:MAG: hypothetical protein OXM54_09190 [Acidimicrobiaceae bacterium]|nr:hypothetical protein [Acidimicrobiaceae bacterium]